MPKAENKKKKKQRKMDIGNTAACKLPRSSFLHTWLTVLASEKGTASPFLGAKLQTATVNTVSLKHGNHLRTPASSTTDFLLQEQLA